MSEKIVVPSYGIDIKGFFDINGTAPTEKEIVLCFYKKTAHQSGFQYFEVKSIQMR